MSNDGGFEESLLTLAKEDPYIWIDGEPYDITVAGKPKKSGGGEPKTDIYLLAKEHDGDRTYEYKISVKKDSFDFYENKIQQTRAANILGDDWSNQVMDLIMEFYDIFWQVPLIYREKPEGLFTLGWRFDITASRRRLSYPLATNAAEKFNILTGGELRNGYVPYDDCTIGEQWIAGAGIANTIFLGSYVPDTTQELIEQLEDAAAYAARIPDMYLSASAVNYRSKKGKLERCRSLLIPVVWKINQWGLLEGAPDPSVPLSMKAGDVYDLWLEPMLAALNIATTDDIVIVEDDKTYANCESWLVDGEHRDGGDFDGDAGRWEIGEWDEPEEDELEYDDMWDADPWNEQGTYWDY